MLCVRFHLILILISLDFSFLICKMEERIATSESCIKDSVYLDVNIDIDVNIETNLNECLDKRMRSSINFCQVR